jgi:hypothetical protein
MIDTGMSDQAPGAHPVPGPGHGPAAADPSAPNAAAPTEPNGVDGADAEEMGLEQQVETLLANVSSAVEEIDAKLSEGAPREPEPIPGDAALNDDGPIAAPTDEPTGAAEPDDASEPDASEEAEPDATGEPADDQVTPESLQAALEEGIEAEPAATAGSRPITDDYGDTGSLDDELAALATDAIEGEIDGDGASDAEETKKYGDTNSLDDELAALASNALEEDLADAIEDVEHAPPPDQPRPQPDAPVDAPPVPEAPNHKAPEPVATAIPADAEPECPDEGSLKWGWLPPRPEWPEVYSRWRPAVIAWRHAVWIVPPLTAFLLRLLGIQARRAEPHVRHAVAIAATPLSKRDHRTRSAIGWLACNTLFWGAALWVWILVARSPAVPEASAPPTALETGGERQATADD